MATTGNAPGLMRKTDWKGAFVLGLAGTILVTGIAPYAVQGLGAASIPLFVVLTGMGVMLCLALAELAAMMPHRTGGLPSYAYETFRPLGKGVARHAGGLSAWAYWLGWFPVAPINMILASAYIGSLLHLPQGASVRPFGSIGAPITVTTLTVSIVGILLMFAASWFGIRFGAAFATVLGVVSMIPLTAFVLLPLARQSKLHWGQVAGFHLPHGTHASLALFAAWAFVMTWSVLAMEAAACYIGECADPERDAKISMSVEGGYGFFIYVLTPVVIVAVLGVTTDTDPLTVYMKVIRTVFGGGATLMSWLIGLPLIVALLLSVLNAIAGSARSLYQVAHDGLLPRWFAKANKHGAPSNSMIFNAAASIVVLFFGSPVRIYVFSNIGYLAALTLALFGYFLYRRAVPDAVRPFRLWAGAEWIALGIALVFTAIWVYGGWNSPALVVGEHSPRLFLLGLAILLAYLPFYGWRRLTDRRAAPADAMEAAPELLALPTDL